MTDIAHPHDRFVKALLSDPESAGTLLRERLPPVIAERLSDEAPELVEGTFVDETLREYLADRLYRARTLSGREVLLYCLIENKSFPERQVAWQLLRYLVRTLEQWEREHPDWRLLPAIVPLVFYHGLQEWRIAEEFFALVDAEEEWRPHLLNFRYTLMNLGQIEDRTLSRNPRLRAWLLVAKYAMREGQQKEMKSIFIEAFSRTPQDVPIFLHYMVEAFRGFQEEDLREIIRGVLPEEEEKMMSQFAESVLSKKPPKWVVDNVRQEGRKEGLQEGLQKGLQEGLQKGLQEGLQKGEVAFLLKQMERRFGKLPEQVVRQVGEATPATLDHWADRIFDARSLDELLAD
ncbi:MAG: Rpn family recombination-promoting nuclease/putative transposase [Magnetococcales bacterium]|nr:Rpn family recombination-promoting nuclease/putative transposase [Magnetococcales bacterium]